MVPQNNDNSYDMLLWGVFLAYGLAVVGYLLRCTTTIYVYSPNIETFYFIEYGHIKSMRTRLSMIIIQMKEIEHEYGYFFNAIRIIISYIYTPL